MWIKSALVWNVTQRREAFPYRRFGTTYWSHIQRSRIPRRISWPLNIWPIVCPETSVSNCHFTLRNIPEELRTYLHRGGTRNRATDVDVGFAQLAVCISPSGWFRFSADNSVRILLSGCTRLRSHRVAYTYAPQILPTPWLCLAYIQQDTRLQAGVYKILLSVTRALKPVCGCTWRTYHIANTSSTCLKTSRSQGQSVFLE